MRVKEYKQYMADFETTVYENQEFTEVWAAAIVELNTENVKVFHSIDVFMNYVFSLPGHSKIYFHNLKFDGFFILSYLMDKLEWQQATATEDSGRYWLQDWEMKSKTFKYLISERGQFYSITIKYGKKIFTFLDSLKLLPFSVKKIGKDFKTKHQKAEIKYTGFRYAGCEITKEEEEYIKNDVLVVKEALEILHSQGLTKSTIGANCMMIYKNFIGGHKAFLEQFPNLSEMTLDKNLYGSETVDQYIRRSYKGGWCYLVPGKANKEYKGSGLTADVNSLYPSMMHSDSGNKYPYGLPVFWKGEIPEIAKEQNYYYFVRIRTRFYLKNKMLPTIQIKHDWKYKSTEWLETSDILYNGKYYRSFRDLDGITQPARVTLTLTQTDFELLKEHYYLEDFEILDGCYFPAMSGMFDDYINVYKKIKMESSGAMRALAKLILNNLYGKFSTSTDSSFKLCEIDDSGTIRFQPVPEYKKKTIYIPVGSAITSYARNFTIRAAQENYYGIDKPGFIYADTDSIHCDLKPEEIKGIEWDPAEFNKWDLESQWNYGLFVRQKTYLEIGEDINLKCAGMPDKCKALFLSSVDPDKSSKLLEDFDLNNEDLEFLKIKRNFSDFKKGLKVPGKLRPVQIPGGIVLTETSYEIR